MRSRSDTYAAAPATSLAGARGLRVSEKLRTTLQSVIHRFSRPSAGDVLLLATGCTQLFHKVGTLVGTYPWPVSYVPSSAEVDEASQGPTPLLHRRYAKETLSDS